MSWHKGETTYNETPPRMIFCLTTGRSGTMYLAHMINTLPEVQGWHEPWPRWYREQTRSYEGRVDFLLEEKLPTIDRTCWAGHVYVETANQINQGYIEPLLDLGIPFDAIWLKRPEQDVAVSFWRKNIIPGRTALGWHMRPDHESNVLRCKHWEHWTDYTCCLWLAMEKEARNKKYAPMIREAGGQVVETATGQIVSENGFMTLVNNLGLPLPTEKYHEIKNEKKNATGPGLKGHWPLEGFGKQEQVIKDSLNG